MQRDDVIPPMVCVPYLAAMRLNSAAVWAMASSQLTSRQGSETEARIDYDQLRPFTQALLHARAEHRVGVGRVGADDHDDVGKIDALEVLRAGRLAERLLQPVAGGRVADAGAGVDVVVAEAGADQLLDEEGLLVGAARRGDAANRVLAVLDLDASELRGGMLDRLVP